MRGPTQNASTSDPMAGRPDPPPRGEAVAIAEARGADRRSGADVRRQHRREQQARAERAAGDEEVARPLQPRATHTPERDLRERVGDDDEMDRPCGRAARVRASCPAGPTTRACDTIVDMRADRVLADVDALADESGRLHGGSDPHADGQPARRPLRRLRALHRRHACASAASRSSTSPPRAARAHRAHPRVNVVGTRRGRRRGPLVHLNGHFDVVPAGDGWTVDPFGGVVRDGRIYGRGVVRHEGGHRGGGVRGGSDPPRRRRAAGQRSRSAARSTKRAAASPASRGSREHGRIGADRTDFVIIPEPLDVDRICIGHRGVYWFEVADARPHRARQHAVPRRQRDRAHGRMLLDRMRAELKPALAARTTADAGRPAGRAPRDDQHQRHRRRPAGRTASRRRASPIAAARCSIAASCSRKASTRRRREIVALLDARRRAHARASLRAQRPDGRAPDAHAGRTRR